MQAAAEVFGRTSSVARICSRASFRSGFAVFPPDAVVCVGSRGSKAGMSK